MTTKLKINIAKPYRLRDLGLLLNVLFILFFIKNRGEYCNSVLLRGIKIARRLYESGAIDKETFDNVKTVCEKRNEI